MKEPFELFCFIYGNRWTYKLKQFRIEKKNAGIKSIKLNLRNIRERFIFITRSCLGIPITLLITVTQKLKLLAWKFKGYSSYIIYKYSEVISVRGICYV
jgi:hypothetical protein